MEAEEGRTAQRTRTAFVWRFSTASTRRRWNLAFSVAGVNTIFVCMAAWPCNAPAI